MESTTESEILAGADREPLKLSYETVTLFSTPRVILRSRMTINSMEIGVLEQEQYRYVARRTNQSEQLFRRQLHKVLEAFPAIRKEKSNVQAISIPVYNRMLKKGNLGAVLFDELTAHPSVSAGELIMEVSADILFEDLEPMAAELKRVRDMGVKIAIWELGDPFCPLLRVKEIPCDYIFLDSYPLNFLNEEEKDWFSSLCRLLHSNEKTRVIAPGLPQWELTELCENLGCDGYSLGENAEPPAPEEEDA